MTQIAVVIALLGKDLIPTEHEKCARTPDDRCVGTLLGYIHSQSYGQRWR